MKLTAIIALSVVLGGCSSLLKDQDAQEEQRVNVYTQLGIGYMNQNRLASALEALEDALYIKPEDSPANHAMALLKIRLGEPDEARTHFGRALETDPRNVAARNDFGSFLCNQGDWVEGIDNFERARRDPFNTEVYVSQFGLGKCLLLSGDPSAAREQFRDALVAQPTNFAILYESAVASFELADFLSARGFLQRLFSTGQETAAALLLAVRTELRLGADDLAQGYATRLRSGFPTSQQAKDLDLVLGLKSNG